MEGEASKMFVLITGWKMTSSTLSDGEEVVAVLSHQALDQIEGAWRLGRRWEAEGRQDVAGGGVRYIDDFGILTWRRRLLQRARTAPEGGLLHK